MKKTFFIVLLAGSSLSLLAQNDSTQGRNTNSGTTNMGQSQTTGMNGTAGNVDAASFVNKNIRDNMMELGMLRMGQRKTNDSQLVRATTVMIADHQQMHSDLQRYAKMKNITVQGNERMGMNSGDMNHSEGMDNRQGMNNDQGTGNNTTDRRRGRSNQAGSMNSSDNGSTSANAGSNGGTIDYVSSSKAGTNATGGTGNTAMQSTAGAGSGSSSGNASSGRSGTNAGSTATGSTGSNGSTGSYGNGSGSATSQDNMGTSSANSRNNVGTTGGNTMDASTGTNNTASQGSNGQGDMSEMQNRRAMHQQLISATGADFNIMFARQMATMHQAKLTELQNASANLTDMELKGIVDKAIPKIRQHLEMLTRINSGTKPTNQ